MTEILFWPVLYVWALCCVFWWLDVNAANARERDLRERLANEMNRRWRNEEYITELQSARCSRCGLANGPYNLRKKP